MLKIAYFSIHCIANKRHSFDTKIDTNLRVNFFLRGKNHENSVCRVWGRYSYGGYKKEFKTEIITKRKDWPKTGRSGRRVRYRILTSDPGHATKNSILNGIEERILYIATTTTPYVDQVISKYFRETIGLSFDDATNDYLEVLQGRVKNKTLSISTYNSARATFNKVKKLYPGVKFDTFGRGFDDIFFDDIVNDGMTPKTANLYLGFLITFLGWAEKNEYTRNSDYRFWKNKKTKSKSFALSKDELKTLEAMSEEVVLQHFLFMCYTGLRPTELYNLVPSELSGDILRYKKSKQRGGNVSFNFIRLNQKALRIWEKLEGKFSPMHLKHRSQSIAMFNNRLREIFLEAGINSTFYLPNGERALKREHVGAKTGRRTFGTLQLQAGAAIHRVRDALGHASVVTTENYDHSGPEDAFGIMDNI